MSTSPPTFLIYLVSFEIHARNDRLFEDCFYPALLAVKAILENTKSGVSPGNNFTETGFDMERAAALWFKFGASEGIHLDTFIEVCNANILVDNEAKA